MTSSIIERPDLRNRTGVFKDRQEAGICLARALEEFRGQNAIVLAVPTGGVPVGLAIKSHLQLPFDLLIIRKLPIPGNTEAGFGSLSLEGDMLLNEGLVHRLRLSSREIEEEAENVRKELEWRNHIFREDRPWPDLKGRIAILVDDGLASGYTMMSAAIIVRRRDPSKIVVAVPTAPLETLERIESYVDMIMCLNIRDERRFAVAESYKNWYDLPAEEVLFLLRQHGLIGSKSAGQNG